MVRGLGCVAVEEEEEESDGEGWVYKESPLVPFVVLIKGFFVLLFVECSVVLSDLDLSERALIGIYRVG